MVAVLTRLGECCLVFPPTASAVLVPGRLETQDRGHHHHQCPGKQHLPDQSGHQWERHGGHGGEDAGQSAADQHQAQVRRPGAWPRGRGGAASKEGLEASLTGKHGGASRARGRPEFPRRPGEEKRQQFQVFCQNVEEGVPWTQTFLQTAVLKISIVRPMGLRTMAVSHFTAA